MNNKNPKKYKCYKCGKIYKTSNKYDVLCPDVCVERIEYDNEKVRYVRYKYTELLKENNERR